jgi:hypothetical protein
MQTVFLIQIQVSPMTTGTMLDIEGNTAQGVQGSSFCVEAASSCDGIVVILVAQLLMLQTAHIVNVVCVTEWR